MRILCLHGAGTSAEIFKSQTSALRWKLDETEYKFDFLDAPHPWKPGPGVGPFFDGPYYSWWTDWNENGVKAAVDELLKYLKAQDEPYDALMGFSQGCHLIAMAIMWHQKDFPGEPLPFKGAIFLCGGVPLYVLEKWIHVPEETKRIIRESGDALTNVRAQTPLKVEKMLQTGERSSLWDMPTALWDGKDEKIGPTWDTPSFTKTNVFGLDVSNLPQHVQIDIPTFHVYGHKDPMCTASLILSNLCREDRRQVYDHGGGHDIPRPSWVSEDLAGGIRRVKERIAEGKGLR
ncbi:Hypothetical predicted protein [Lecanosticta acicola]|uniref:Serine hydrolase domain-containing protein n=1 Tax=Lecanosticta acicola TaxID=111012 RepID=A0AAI8W0Y8_9PEZI|nr:Hypothetical predicted protein [Lecanosticta acicola]